MSDVNYNLEASLVDNLKMFKGKRVNLIVAGSTMSGTLKEVSNRWVHLEKIVDKDFFDALIRIDQIAAIEAQFRGFDR